jgi:hypothetical protein
MSDLRLGAAKVSTTGAIGCGAVLLLLVLFFLCALFYGWLVILGFGIVHSFAPSVPAIGLWWTGFGLGAILAFLTPNNKS